MFRTERRTSVPRPGTPTATSSSTRGRSRIPGPEAGAPRPSETPHFGFGLRAPEIVERAGGLLGSAELAAEVAPHLRHAEHGLRRDKALVRHARCDDIDRTCTLLDRLPRL